ncbi:uncharacterized protein [Mobula birostris]|uniref:uncharacterized protein n=1 Tax=Mobula birostris TaxID=1983395 RepID=UPI003B27EF3E
MSSILFWYPEFLPEQFVREKIQTQKFNNSEDWHHNSKECLENPIILLRKWTGEGFVGILDLPAVLLTWDQLFMQDWKAQVMEDFCLTILLLLREPLMEVNDQHSLKWVFFSYANHLYTVDIQRSWIHLQQGGLPSDIPELNQLKLSDSLHYNKEEEERGRFEKGSLRSSSSDDHILTVPWVAHNPSVALPDPARVNEPFDLYIDAIRYIPDNATITKVTGRLIHSGRDDIPDVLAFPVITSRARCPEFRYRMTVNVKGKATLDPNALVLLRVNTVDSDTGKLSVIGNTVVSLFNKHGGLNVGGFQLKLRRGMPSKGQTLLTASSLNHHPMIPCCSLLIRLLPHTQDPVPPPGYLSGFYFTEDAEPNKSELEIISSFQQDKEFTVSVGDTAASLMSKEQTEVLCEQWKAWYEERLDERKHLPPQQPPEHLSIIHMVRYRQRAGLRI